MNKTKKYIAVGKTDREFLMKAFGVSSVMVWASLQFKKDTPLAKKIRKCALERGGVTMVVQPEMETMFFHDKTMHQYFENGAVFEASLTDGKCAVLKNGFVRRQYNRVMINDIPAIQEFAKSL